MSKLQEKMAKESAAVGRTAEFKYEDYVGRVAKPEAVAVPTDKAFLKQLEREGYIVEKGKAPPDVIKEMEKIVKEVTVPKPPKIEPTVKIKPVPEIEIKPIAEIPVMKPVKAEEVFKPPKVVTPKPIKIQPTKQEKELSVGLAKVQKKMSEQMKDFEQEFIPEKAIEYKPIQVPKMEEVTAPAMFPPVEIQMLDLEKVTKMPRVPKYPVPTITRMPTDMITEVPEVPAKWFPRARPRRRARARRKEPSFEFPGMPKMRRKLEAMPFKPYDWGLPKDIASREAWVTEVPIKRKRRKKAQKRKKKKR